MCGSVCLFRHPNRCSIGGRSHHDNCHQGHPTSHHHHHVHHHLPVSSNILQDQQYCQAHQWLQPGTSLFNNLAICFFNTHIFCHFLTIVIDILKTKTIHQVLRINKTFTLHDLCFSSPNYGLPLPAYQEKENFW